MMRPPPIGVVLDAGGLESVHHLAGAQSGTTAAVNDGVPDNPRRFVGVQSSTPIARLLFGPVCGPNMFYDDIALKRSTGAP